MSRAALTQLADEEIGFRDTIRKFASAKIAPLVRAMDEAQAIDPSLLTKLFELGLTGIEIPEQYGGSAGTFFDSILAVEAISEASSGSDAFALQTRATRTRRQLNPQRPEALDHQRPRILPLPRLRHPRPLPRLQRPHRLRVEKGIQASR